MNCNDNIHWWQFGEFSEYCMIIYCHRNSSLYLHYYQFPADQISQQKALWSNPSKYLHQSHISSTITVLWPSYGHISNYLIHIKFIMIIMDEIFVYRVWYDGHNRIIFDMVHDWYRFMEGLDRKTYCDKIWWAENWNNRVVVIRCNDNIWDTMAIWWCLLNRYCNVMAWGWIIFG